MNATHHCTDRVYFLLLIEQHAHSRGDQRYVVAQAIGWRPGLVAKSQARPRALVGEELRES